MPFDLKQSLPEETTDKLIGAFREADTTGDGFIDKLELSMAVKRIFPALDKRTTELTTHLLMEMADKNGDGKLDFNEFREAIQQRQSERRDAVDGVLFHVLSQEHPLHHIPASHIEKMLNAFTQADIDKSNYVEPNEVIEVLRNSFPNSDVDMLEDVGCVIMDTADRDKDGKISMGEFLNAFAKEHQKMAAAARGDGNTLGAAVPELQMFYSAISQQNALVHLPPAESDVLLKAFDSSMEDASLMSAISHADVLKALKHKFQGVSADLLDDVACIICDTMERDNDGVIQLKAFYDAVRHAQSLMKKDHESGVIHPEGVDGVMSHHLSTANPLFHMTPRQVEVLLQGFNADVPLKPDGYEGHDDILAYLRLLFPRLDVAILDDVAWILVDTCERNNADRIDLTRFVGCFRSQRYNKKTNTIPYRMPHELVTKWQESLSMDEIDILRDTFIRLDENGDGFVTKGELFAAVETVLGDKKFSGFEPYLNSVFKTADVDHDSMLNLSEFLSSFANGIGVAPQQVVVECVAKVRIRLTNEQLVTLQETFSAMDVDNDGYLDARELHAALKRSLASRFPDLSDTGFQELVQIILEAADRDHDGKLNLAEFIRSFQEDQGVLPAQLVESRATLIFKKLSPQDAETFTKVLTEVSATTAEYVEYETLNHLLHEALEPQIDMLQGDIDFLIENILLSTDRDHEGRVSMRAFVRSFSLGLHTHPNDAPHTPRRHASNVMSAEELQDSARRRASAVGETVHLTPRRDGSQPQDQQGENPANSATNASSAKEAVDVLLIDEADRLYRKVFRYFDTNNDGYVTLTDLETTLLRLLKHNHPEWPDRTVVAVAESLFCAADVDEDGRLSEQEFVESFTMGYGIFPEEYINAMRLRLVVDLTTAEVENLRLAFNRIDANHDGYLSPQEIQQVLTEMLCPDFDEGTVAALAQTILGQVDENSDGKISFREFLHSFERDQNIMALPVLAAGQHAGNAMNVTDTSFQNVSMVNTTMDTTAQFTPSRPQQYGGAGSAPGPRGHPAAMPYSDANNQHAMSMEGAPSSVGATVGEQSVEGHMLPQPAKLLTPYDIDQLRHCFTDIDRNKDGFVDASELRLVLQEAVGTLFQHDVEKVELVVGSVMSIVNRSGDGRIPFHEFADAFRTNPEVLQMPIEAVQERVAKTEEALEGLLLEEDLRQIAKVFVHLDKDKNGVLDFSEVHDEVFSLLTHSHPEWREAQIETVVRQLYNTADVNKDGVLTLNEFIMSFASKHYVLPPQYVEREAAQLRRRLTEDEMMELKTLFRQVDENSDGLLSITELEETLREALANTMSSDTASINAIIASVLAVVDTNRDGFVSFSEFVAAYEKDTTVLDVPIMAAAQRREMAERQLNLLLSERDLRSLSKVFLFLDTNGDGFLSPEELHDAMYEQLRISHPEWDNDRLEEAINVLITSADINADGQLSLDEFIGSFVEGHYVLPPSYIREVCADLARPLSNDEVIRLKAAFDEMDTTHKGFVTEVELRKVISHAVRDKAKLDAIVEAILITADEDDDGRLTISDFLKAYQIDGGLLSVPLAALSERIACRVARKVLSTDALRDISRVFVLLDKKQDGFLDLDEIREELAEELSKANPGVAPETLELLARQSFNKADIDQDRLLNMDEFVASFAQQGEPPLLFSLDGVVRLLVNASPDKTPRSARQDKTDESSGEEPTAPPQRQETEAPQSSAADVTANTNAAADQQQQATPTKSTKPHPPPVDDANNQSPHHPSAAAAPSDNTSIASASAVSVGLPGSRRTSAGSRISSTHRRALPGDVSNVVIFDDELQREFNRYDRDGSGYLDKNEFKQIYKKMENFGLEPRPGEIDRLFDQFGGADDKLSFEEFCILMLHRARM